MARRERRFKAVTAWCNERRTDRCERRCISSLPCFLLWRLPAEKSEAERACQQGEEAFARGQLDEAVVHYRKALEIRPDYAEAHANLGNVPPVADRSTRPLPITRRPWKSSLTTWKPTTAWGWLWPVADTWTRPLPITGRHWKSSLTTLKPAKTSTCSSEARARGARRKRANTAERKRRTQPHDAGRLKGRFMGKSYVSDITHFLDNVGELKKCRPRFAARPSF